MAVDSRHEVGALAAPVVGGETVDVCEWPSTVSVNAWGACTGTLIHPRVVTTAAHCIEAGSSKIYFGASRTTPGAFSLEARCEVGADGTRGANSHRDWAYCILPEDERVSQIPVTPPLVGCEAEQFLTPGHKAWVVGFGTTSAHGQGAGTKRQVEVVINALDKQAQGTIDVGDAEAGACHGDSGGPLYVHLTDGEHDWGYRVAGSTSGAGARSCDCSCSTVYVNIENHVQAIEEREGIDVTPCTDADGHFDPSPACANLVTAPQEASGAFPSCEVARTIERIDSCGVLPRVATTDAAAAVSGAAAAAEGPASVSGEAQAGADGGLAVTPSAAPSMPVVGQAASVLPVSAAQPGVAGAAGRPAIGSAIFSSSAAGAPATLVQVESASQSASGGCQVTLAGSSHGRRSGLLWLSGFALCLVGGARVRRRAAR